MFVCLRGDVIGLKHLTEPDVCLVAVGRIDHVETPRELFPTLDQPSNEWMTRHEIDGTMTFSDPRSAAVAALRSCSQYTPNNSYRHTTIFFCLNIVSECIHSHGMAAVIYECL